MKVVMVLAALAMTVVPAAAEETVTVNGKPWVYDPYEAADIMRTCASCHGENGAGGGGGVYPRLAGLNPDYLAEQLRKFKSHERENIPMIPYATERELPEGDVLTITRYLSELKVTTKLPDNLPADGFARLEAMKKVLHIPQEAGDTTAGRTLYEADCAACHGPDGQGRLRKPPLAGQHIKYLRTQIDNFVGGKRPHPDVDKIMRPRRPADWDNVWAYVTSLQDAPAAKPAAAPAAPMDYDLSQ